MAPSTDAVEHLLREGIEARRIQFVGNVMVDALVRMLPRARARASNWVGTRALWWGRQVDRFALATFHRPGNVDNPETLGEIAAALTELSRDGLPVILPLHPRTVERVGYHGIRFGHRVSILPPLGYLDFLALMDTAVVVLTDSGGIQEETTYLGVPCVTVRPNTERPVTVTEGTNRLSHATREAIVAATRIALKERRRPLTIPALWDGRASGRIVAVLKAVDRPRKGEN